MLRIGVLGATGYSGQELIRLLHSHGEVRIEKIFSESNPGKKFSFVYRSFTGWKENICEELNWESLADGIDVLFSALPYGVLMQHLTYDILQNVQLIDIGVDYRFMNREEYLKYYKKEHKSIELAKEFTYGLSEWNRNRIRTARHIANPGCYATAMQLALLPLMKENIIDVDVIADGKCGLSGAGRTLTVGTHFTEANESTKTYKLVNHPHTQETTKGIEFFSGKNIRLTFTPHIVPMQRGMLVTAYAVLKNPIEDKDIRAIYNEYYGNEQFIRILDKGMYVETKWVKCSNMCHINFEINQDTNKLIVAAAIDNLVKGAAGQAIQNMNLMFDFPENAGLDYVPVCI
jgi:N-acetyl-gamma-glutamyl-phosphate reductase